MYRMVMFVVSLVTLVTAGSRASGAVLDVPTAQYPTIQSAIIAAGTGDEILVAAGTYFETFGFDGKAITVRSAEGPAQTILDGSGLGNSVVRFVDGEGPGSVLEGFTIRGGTGNTDFGAPVGGGVFVFLGSPRITRCILSTNSATLGGGAYVLNGAPTFQSCIFTDNTSGEGAGLNCALSNTIVTNCTFLGNAAQTAGGGIYNSGPNTVVSNSIFWENSDNTGIGELAQIHDPNGAVTVTYSIVQGIEGLAGSPGNLGDDPGFFDAANRDLRLLPGSPAIDSGSNNVTGLPTLDLVGLPRRIDDGAIRDTGLGSPPIVDIGAHEAPGDCDGNGVPDESDSDIDGDGFIDACDGCPDSAPDTGVGDSGCPLVRNVTQDALFGTIQAAIDAAVDGDQIVLLPASYRETINLKGKAIRLYSQDGPAVTSIGPSTPDVTVVTCDTGEGPETVIEGLTISGGSAPQGGGMLNNGSSPTVVNCRFELNDAIFGAGMYNEQGAMPSVINCTFTDNVASQAGGGIANVLSNPRVINCDFHDNFAQIGGGGLYARNADPLVSGCTFFSNDAGLFGGGILSDTSSPTITNSIFWNNTEPGPNISSAQIKTLKGSPVLEFSCIQGGWSGPSGTGNISVDPLFVDAVAGDLRLATGSPCIDAGSNIGFMLAATPPGVSVDHDGVSRFADDPGTPDTGIGFGLVIDMGSHEFNPPSADFDRSGHVDLFDFAKFLEMFTGPASAANAADSTRP